MVQRLAHSRKVMSLEIHLLDSGINLRYILELSGIKVARQPQSIVHVSDNNLKKIRYSLESIVRETKEEK